MKIKVPAHTRNGKKVKGYTYTRGTTKRKPVRRTRHRSPSEAEQAEMRRIMYNRIKRMHRR